MRILFAGGPGIVSGAVSVMQIHHAAGRLLQKVRFLQSSGLFDQSRP